MGPYRTPDVPPEPKLSEVEQIIKLVQSKTSKQERKTAELAKEERLRIILNSEIKSIIKLIVQNIPRYEYMDNERVALSTDPEQVAEYNDRKENGCCGSVDRQLKIGDKVYLVGFNYGH